MKLLLHSADVDEVRWAADAGLLDGLVVSSPLLAARGRGDDAELLGELAAVAKAPVHVPVRAVDRDGMYRDARELARISDLIVVQLPFIEDALPVIRRLAVDGIRVAAFAVFHPAQAVLAAKAGAGAVMLHVAQLDHAGHDGAAVAGQLRRVLDAAAPECEVIGVDPSSATQFADCALAGVDACALPAALIRSLLLHPLTDRGLDLFLSELSRRPRPRALP